MTEPTLVIGHRNPDTDAIASAVGYAWLLNRLNGGQGYIAGRAGELNAQTIFALKRFNVDAPQLVVDVWRQVGELAEPLPSLNQNQTLLEACQSIAKSRRPTPILDDKSKPVGLLSGAELFALLADALSSTSALEVSKALKQRAENAVDNPGIVFHASEHIRDILGQALRSEQDDFIVIDQSGRYIGLCRKSALLAPPRRKLIMVDHNEPGQAVPGLEDTELLEVLDHHRLGNLPTVVPIRFRVEPVGSCSTLVAEQSVDANVALDPPIAGLLLCGILSDTLVFRSPTTTSRDQAIAFKLAVMANLITETATDEQKLNEITKLGNELLAAGAGIGTRPADEVINSDLKFYETGGVKAGIAQVEVTTFRELTPRMPELTSALERLAASKNLGLALLMVTDVVRGNSQLIAIGHERIISALPYSRVDNHLLDAPDVVSRKKQLLPAVLAAMSQSI